MPRSLTVCGLGGVGKTQTTLEFVYQYKDMFDVIFWAAADTRLKLDQAYGCFASALGLLTSSTPANTDQVREDVKKWLCNSGE
jgi:hypothetical protein